MEHEPLSPALSPRTARVGWCWMAFQYLLLPQLLSQAAGLLPLEISDAAVNFLYHFLSFLGVFLIFRSYLWDSLRWAAVHWRRCALVCAAALGIYYAATWAVTLAVTCLEPAFANRNNEAILRLRREGLALTALSTVFFAPLPEESLFRGLIFSRVRFKSRVGAYALSAVCFGLIHVMGYLGAYTPLQFALSLLQYLPAGLILAWSHEKSGTIAAPILIHTIINAVSMVQIL
ncbi:MAG: lysostaphin resistance A-like protein [Faecousia sp.]